MPTSAMMKVTPRYGDRFSCGALPPVLVTAEAESCAAVGSAVEYCDSPHTAGVEFAGDGELAVGLPEMLWLCTGSWLPVSVTVSVPASWPITAVCPAPVPWWTGNRPRRSGSPNVFWPSPPYVVPMSWNNAALSAIDSSWPSHRAQPAGAKLPPNIRSSPMYG